MIIAGNEIVGVDLQGAGQELIIAGISGYWVCFEGVSGNHCLRMVQC
jgi:hypothetical protein